MKKVLVHPKVKEAIIHPFVFAVFPVLSLYVTNVGMGPFREALVIATGVFIFAGLLWLLVGLFVKDRNKSAIIVSVFCVLFFSYGHAISASSAILERMHLLDKAKFFVEGKSSLLFWLVIWVGVFVAALFFVKSARDLRLVTKFLNIVALTLTVMVGVNYAIAGVNKFFLIPRLHADAKPSADANQNGFDLAEFKDSWQQSISLEDANVTTGSLPDIYYIIVDAYARADILEEVYQFDNSEFLSYLAEKGFYVANESRANYPQTDLCLSSSLNFMYLDGLVDQIGAETDNRQPLQMMIKNNKVFQHLRNHGYTIFAFSSGHGPTEITNADKYRAPPKWHAPTSQFQEALVTLTPLSIFRRTWFDVRRVRVTYAFDHVADATRVDGPTFVFVHVQVPHWPFIFDADGEPVQPRKGIGRPADYEYDEFIEGYRDQLVFVNKRLQIAIDEILSQSPVPPIIIVQADHGPDAKLDRDWKIENTYLPERMSILNAYYFPDQNYKALYEDITPVNTFRIILNNYFGTDYELLEDKSYFSGGDRPYLFIDVTDEVVVGN